MLFWRSSLPSGSWIVLFWLPAETLSLRRLLVSYPPSFTGGPTPLVVTIVRSFTRLSNAVNNIATAAVGPLSRNRRDWISGGGAAVRP
jgi:hypothetical protein